MLNMSAVTALPPGAELQDFQDALDAFLGAQRRVRGRFNRVPVVPELSLSQYHLLVSLATSGGPRPVGELAEDAGVSPPSATRMLDGLQERGIVERSTRNGDRRVVLIDLTPHGRELVDAKLAHVNEARAAIYARLTPAERRAAAGLLQSLATAMEELHP